MPGPQGVFNCLLRATFAGGFLPLCRHCMLAVGVTRHERGASAGQIMALLLAGVAPNYTEAMSIRDITKS